MNTIESRPSAPVNIVLAGFMGTGKSTVGRLVARVLGWAFVDTDEVITERAGYSIVEIFAQDGEAAFRQLEAVVCQELAQQPKHVIATGGGALINLDTRRAFEASGLVIGLRCDLDQIIQRVGHDPGRPLFSAERDRLVRLLDERADLYNSLPHQIDTTHAAPEHITQEIVRLWQHTQSDT
ncbi:MAG: shikimate kinase [Chloroflexi bacterium]|nr:shikimate kinase [Chloroflexota bacterium]